MNFPFVESCARPESGPRALPGWVPAASTRLPSRKRRAPSSITDSDGVATGTLLGAKGTMTVTLYGVDSLEPTSAVILEPNRCGQLPTVLVDPIDVNGQVAFGMWLGDGCDGTTYELTIRRGADAKQVATR